MKDTNLPDSSDTKELTHFDIWHIVLAIREGKASLDDARRLLEKFCNEFDKGMYAQDYLLHYLRDAFHAYLNKEKTIEAALGLKKKKGRPGADEQAQIKMAAEVLRCRLHDMPHQEALMEVSENFGCGETIVAKAWAECQLEAILLLRYERRDKSPWTPSEIQKMDKVFGDKPWYMMPGKPHSWDTSEK
jgi:hypothetical protein